MNSLYTEAVRRLNAVCPQGEARAIVRTLLEDAFGVSMNDVYADKVRQFSADEARDFHSMLLRIEKGEPVQYVTGKAQFGNLTLHVDGSVLIPRPETLELAQWAAKECKAGAEILDIGTGSGCLAIFLALNVENSRVTAVDISPPALETAKSNAERCGADIKFIQADVLNPTSVPTGKYNLIISNPPYVCESEKDGMERNVLDHEPATALFVDDSRPLVFYNAIARLAVHPLSPGGAVMVEINRRFPEETAELFRRHGFFDVEVRKDMEGNPRMIKATRK